MPLKFSRLNRRSIKYLLHETLLETIENITLHLNDFLQTHEPETLHQYRVSVRSLRSICLEFHAFLEEKRRHRLENILKALQKQTNNMRDLDVFLEDIQRYKIGVLPSCVDAFSTLEVSIKAEKEEAYRLFEATYTKSYKEKLLDELRTIQKDEKLYMQKSSETTCQQMRAILKKRLKKIIKASYTLQLDSPNEQFHKLRLHYKKLRYNADAIKLSQFSKSFKGIQNAFGRVQDKNTQIERLKRYQTPENECLEHIIAALEHELLADKQACIEVSNKESIVKIEKKLKKLFTCKSR